MIQYVVFNTTTGTPVKWGQCQPELLEAQAEAGERALETQALTVDGNRQALIDEAWKVREAKVASGCETPFGRVRTDAFSLSRVTGVVAGANAAITLNVPFAVNFTMEDGSKELLDATEALMMGLTVMAYVSSCHDRFSAIQTEIEDAADMAALLAIDINEGWPE